MTVGGLQHVSLETRHADAEAEARFWTLLGFTRIPPPASLGESRAWWFQAPDGVTQIHLLFSEDDVAPVTPPSGHVAVIVDGWIATTTALTAAGFSIEERTPHWDAPRAYVRTPGGHRVELMAAPPAA